MLRMRTDGLQRPMLPIPTNGERLNLRRGVSRQRVPTLGTVQLKCMPEGEKPWRVLPDNRNKPPRPHGQS